MYLQEIKEIRILCHVCHVTFLSPNARNMGKDKSEKKEKKRKTEVVADVPPVGDVEMEDTSSVRFLTIEMCASQSHPGSACEEGKERQGGNHHPP